MKTYTAQVGPKNAGRLAEGAPQTIDDIGEGTVQINDLDQLRQLAAEADGSITDDEDGLQIWIDGESYPLFDDTDAAVADALGSQTQYVEAKRSADHARELYAQAVAAVVERAGSVQQAADLMGVDVAEVQELMPAPVEAVALPDDSTPPETVVRNDSFVK